jgi:hypothetical protein
VRVQLEDIMNFQKMDLISAGTDFDTLRLVSYFLLMTVMSPFATGKL